MNEVEFNKLSNDLRELVIRIPLVWGAVQNNGMDSLMTAESFFKISSYEELEKSIVSFPDAAKKTISEGDGIFSSVQDVMNIFLQLIRA